MRKKPRNWLDKLKKILLLLVLVVSAAFFFKNIKQDDIFPIKSLNCTRDEFVCRQNDENILSFLYGKSLVFTTDSDIESLIKNKDFTIERANLKKNFPSSLSVELISREPIAKATVGKQEFLVDGNGFIFKVSSDSWGEYAALPLVLTNSSLVLGEYIYPPQVIDLIKLTNNFYIKPRQLKIIHDNAVLFGSGFEATFDLRKDLQLQVSSLQLILKSSTIGKPSRIDLRFAKPVITFYEQK